MEDQPGWRHFLLMQLVRGYHVYKDIWAAVVGEELPCKREGGNKVDLFAVTVLRDETIVGHVAEEGLSYLLTLPMPRWLYCLLCVSR